MITGTVYIVGKGNVGHHIFAGLKEHLDVQFLERGQVNVPDAAVVIVAVPDQWTLEVCAGFAPEVLVVHTAGAVEMPEGGRRGVFYPLYSFTKDVALNWAEVPLLLESSVEEDLQVLEGLAHLLTDKVYHISTAQREKLHVAAVKVNNFTNHLYTLAFDYAEDHGVPVEVLYPIMRQGPEKAIELGPHHAQTGPAKRGDWNTIEKHLAHLSNEEAKVLYKLLSESIANWHKR